jgi:hypothetical protein
MSVRNIITKKFYSVIPAVGNGFLYVRNLAIPRGKSVPILSSWGKHLDKRSKILEVNNSGNIYIINNRFTPVLPLGSRAKNQKGGIIGKVLFFGKGAGQSIVVPLGKYINFNQVERVSGTIEIIPSEASPAKLRVIERRMDTTGLEQDRSKYIYTIKPHGVKTIRQYIPDLEWIERVKINRDKSISIIYSYNSGDKVERFQIQLPGDLFTDNFGKPLLCNKRVKMDRLEDIYQSNFYSEETRRFQPRIDVYGGNLRLVVEKVKIYEIDKPSELKGEKNFKIFPSTAICAMRVEGENSETWIPGDTKNPVTHKGMIDLGPDGFSHIRHGEPDHAVGAQHRMGTDPQGKKGDISGEKPRDPYFYGLQRIVNRIREKYGSYFAINRAKSLRASRGIQSGRGSMFPWDLLYDTLFADIIETGSKFFKKLSNFASHYWGPGVSEDTQFEIALWLLDIKMHVINELTNIMTAERELARYKTQEENRYILSKTLFRLAAKIVSFELWKGRILGKSPIFLDKMGAFWEIIAGWKWYDRPFAMTAEAPATGTFLGAFGHILFLPVDLALFGISITFLILAESINYLHHLWMLGYRFTTGFFKNPALDLEHLHGYFTANIRQIKKGLQFADFATTHGGSGKGLQRISQAWKWGFAAITAYGVGTLVYSGIVGSLSLISFLGLGTLLNGFFACYFLTLLGISIFYGSKYRYNRTRKEQQKNQKPLSTLEMNYKNIYNEYRDILMNTWDKGYGLDFATLLNYRERLGSILKSAPLNAMNKNGAASVSLDNPWRDVANQMLDAYSQIETMIVLKAKRNIEIGTGFGTPRDALLALRESRNALDKLLNDKKSPSHDPIATTLGHFVWNLYKLGGQEK